MKEVYKDTYLVVKADSLTEKTPTFGNQVYFDCTEDGRVFLNKGDFDIGCITNSFDDMVMVKETIDTLRADEVIPASLDYVFLTTPDCVENALKSGIVITTVGTYVVIYCGIVLTEEEDDVDLQLFELLLR